MVSLIILLTISLLAFNANSAFWSSSTETTYDMNGCDAYFKSLSFFFSRIRSPRQRRDKCEFNLYLCIALSIISHSKKELHKWLIEILIFIYFLFSLEDNKVLAFRIPHFSFDCSRYKKSCMSLELLNCWRLWWFYLSFLSFFLSPFFFSFIRPKGINEFRRKDFFFAYLSSIFQ